MHNIALMVILSYINRTILSWLRLITYIDQKKIKLP